MRRSSGKRSCDRRGRAMAKRKPKARTTRTMSARAKSAGMTEARFWKLIEAARQADDFINALTANLEDLPARDIVDFQNLLHRKVAEARTFEVLAANFIIQGYVSDDVFEDFRAWLVSQGRKRFEAAVADPESICDWFERSEVDDIHGEAVLFAAQRAFEEHGDEEDFDAQIKYPRPK